MGSEWLDSECKNGTYLDISSVSPLWEILYKHIHYNNCISQLQSANAHCTRQTPPFFNLNTCTCTHTCRCTRTHTGTHTCTHSYTNTQTHTHAHTHTQCIINTHIPWCCTELVAVRRWALAIAGWKLTRPQAKEKKRAI